jgi:hypothetical protein
MTLLRAVSMVVVQQHNMARHHELQGKLWWLPAAAGLVEPIGQGQR